MPRYYSLKGKYPHLAGQPIPHSGAGAGDLRRAAIAYRGKMSAKSGGLYYSGVSESQRLRRLVIKAAQAHGLVANMVTSPPNKLGRSSQRVRISFPYHGFSIVGNVSLDTSATFHTKGMRGQLSSMVFSHGGM